MEGRLKLLLFAFVVNLLFLNTIYAQDYKKYVGFEYRNTDSILKEFIKLPGTFYDQEMKYAIEVFKGKINGQKFLFFQKYFTVEGNQSHRKILDIVGLKEGQSNDHYSAMCFPNSNLQQDIIIGLYYTKEDISESQIVVQPIKAWKTNFSKNKLEPMDPSKVQCLFGVPDDFPG